MPRLHELPMREKRRHETDETLCGHPSCTNCEKWRLTLKKSFRQHNIDAGISTRNSGSPECPRCTSFFRKGRWQDEVSYILKESFADLEFSADWCCRSCRLIRQAIIFDCPNFKDLEALRKKKRPVWVLGTEGGDDLRVEYGMWPRILTLPLSENYQGMCR